MPPKGSKKGTNQAPWWWELAVGELWAAEGKPIGRPEFHLQALEALDSAHGGAHQAKASSMTNWSTAGEFLLCCAQMVTLICDATDLLFNKILEVRNLTRFKARAAAIKGGLCLGDDCSILEHMSTHLQSIRDGKSMIVMKEVSAATLRSP
jgi:hypothetical protein